jgi:hypothetical protein
VRLRTSGFSGGEGLGTTRREKLRPHYHYDPGDKNERYDIDKTTAGNPISWTMKQLCPRLPAMLERAGFAEIATSWTVAWSCRNWIRWKRPPGIWPSNSVAR